MALATLRLLALSSIALVQVGSNTSFSAVPPPGSASVRRWMDVSAQERQARLDEASSKNASIAERLVEMSEGFLGTPYLASPLGEGSGKDPDPLIRFDAVDCLTFVEETMALGLARSSDELERLLTQIRYASDPPSYEKRNHLMEAQWIPNNLRKGFIKSVTHRFGGDRSREVWKEISERTWASKSSRQLGLRGSDRPMGRFLLEMIDLDRILPIARQLPTGTLLLVVREERPFSVTRVSHVGFVIQRGRRTYLRHATRTVGKVVDEDLQSFLVRNSGYGRWKVVGVSLFEIEPPSSGAPASPANAARP